VKLDEAEYHAKLDEAVSPVKLDELWYPGRVECDPLLVKDHLGVTNVFA